MDLDDELEQLEASGETDAEWTDQQSELFDEEDDEDELFGEDAAESDLEHAYDSFSTPNEADYDGWDDSEVAAAESAAESADILHGEGYSVEDTHDLEQEVIEMELEDGDIYAYLVDEDENEIGFVLLDEDGNEQEYYYVDDVDSADNGEGGSDPQPKTEVIRASDGEEFDLGITRESVAETTADLNAIYKDGSEVISELKEALDDINESFNFLKKKK